MDADAPVHCACCGRTLPRRKVHALGDGATFVCRRCGLWIALRLHSDPGTRHKRGDS